MSFRIIVRLLAIFIATLFLSSGTSAAYGPVAFCLAAQEAADDCCEEAGVPNEDCQTDCCFEMATIEMSILAQERSPVKPYLARPAHGTYSRLVNTPVKNSASGLQSVHDPATLCARDQRRAELQVRLN